MAFSSRYWWILACLSAWPRIFYCLAFRNFYNLDSRNFWNQKKQAFIKIFGPNFWKSPKCICKIFRRRNSYDTYPPHIVKYRNFRPPSPPKKVRRLLWTAPYGNLRWPFFSPFRVTNIWNGNNLEGRQYSEGMTVIWKEWQ